LAQGIFGYKSLKLFSKLLEHIHGRQEKWPFGRQEVQRAQTF